MHPSSIYGHDTIRHQLEREHANGTLPHGLLFSGTRGIGKAQFARDFAKTLLAGDDTAAQARIDIGSHADLMLVSRLFDKKKGEFNGEITAEQTREISHFLSLTAAETDWQVVIVDDAETMNDKAANALLKILEEPPAHSLIILIAHQPNLLLPTIRSRCHNFRFLPLNKKNYTSIMRAKLPEASNTTISTLGALSNFSPGIALELHEQEALEMFDQIQLIFSELPTLSHQRIATLAGQVASGTQHQNFKLFSVLILHMIEQCAKQGHSEQWAKKWQKTQEEFALATARHLDYKSVIIQFFHELA